MRISPVSGVTVTHDFATQKAADCFAYSEAIILLKEELQSNQWPMAASLQRALFLSPRKHDIFIAGFIQSVY